MWLKSKIINISFLNHLKSITLTIARQCIEFFDNLIDATKKESYEQFVSLLNYTYGMTVVLQKQQQQPQKDLGIAISININNNNNSNNTINKSHIYYTGFWHPTKVGIPKSCSDNN
jgi:hypothetical protein